MAKVMIKSNPGGAAVVERISPLIFPKQKKGNLKNS
jgi:hypothetical protein